MLITDRHVIIKRRLKYYGKTTIMADITLNSQNRYLISSSLKESEKLKILRVSKEEAKENTAIGQKKEQLKNLKRWKRTGKKGTSNITQSQYLILQD